jgi:hypothetical protein
MLDGLDDGDRWLLRAGRAAVDPNLQLSNGFGAVERRQCPAVAWIPAPTDQIVLGNMIEERLQVSAPILLGIFNLLAEFWGRASDKDHF